MTIGFQCASPSFFPSLMLRNPIPQLLVKWSELSVNIYEFEEGSFHCGSRGEGKLGGIGRSGGRGNHHQKSEEEIIIQTHCMKKKPYFQ